MKITRQIDTQTARYTLEDINDSQFSFLLASVNHYTMYTHHCIPDKDSPFGELLEKLKKMKSSSVTIIN